MGNKEKREKLEQLRSREPNPKIRRCDEQIADARARRKAAVARLREASCC